MYKRYKIILKKLSNKLVLSITIVANVLTDCNLLNGGKMECVAEILSGVIVTQDGTTKGVVRLKPEMTKQKIEKLSKEMNVNVEKESDDARKVGVTKILLKNNIFTK